MRTFTAEATLKAKNLDKVKDAEELVKALHQQCEVQVATPIIRLPTRAGMSDFQVILPLN